MSAENDYRNKRNDAVCRRLITHLRKHGWEATLADNEPIDKLSIPKKVEVITNLDGANIWFENSDRRMHYVVFTGYNNAECDCIPDYSFSEGDKDGFMALLDAFTDKLDDQPYRMPKPRKPAKPAAVIGEVSKEDDALIAQIADRAYPLYHLDKLSTIMDLTCVHARTPLRLQALLDAPAGDFGHDITGIYLNLDRTTGTLRNLFSPRCTA